MADEIGWVIERGDTPVSAPLYYAPQTQAGWVADHAAACRFAREQDAQVIVDAYCLDDQDGVRICEHMWLDPRAEAGRDESVKRFGERLHKMFSDAADRINDARP